jgi:hypothetical protein
VILHLRKLLSILLIPAALLLTALPSDLLAQSHVTSPADLRAQLRDSAAGRQNRVSHLQQFLSTGQAEATMRTLRVDPAQARQAVSLLSDEELARLAAQVDRSEFAGAGLALTNEQVTIIIVGAILIIIVAVIASR